MLTHLSIRQFVLIDTLDVDFSAGLTALTGETGAGKSIILDALGAALGARADGTQVRVGAPQADIAAVFQIDTPAPALKELLDTQEITLDNGELIFRRTIQAEGRSRCFLNDRLVSVGYVRQVGEMLLEVHGQGDRLIQPTQHRQMVDDLIARTQPTLFQDLEASHKTWATARQALADFEAQQQNADRLRADLQHQLDQLTKVNPKADEEDTLLTEKRLQGAHRSIAETLGRISAILSDAPGVITALTQGMRAMDRLPPDVAISLAPIRDGLDKALIELIEVDAATNHHLQVLDADPTRLEYIEDRLHALHQLARYHSCPVAELPNLQARLQQQFDALQNIGATKTHLESAVHQAWTAFEAQALVIRRLRHQMAAQVEDQIHRLLEPLKLHHMHFKVQITPENATCRGLDHVEFTIDPNNTGLFQGLGKIASGGELSRLMLALKTLATTAGSAQVLIFDEIDIGVGGSVATAIGQHLAKLACTHQVLSITHSPQVAVCATQHLRVHKEAGTDGTIVTRLIPLDDETRLEEIARMLSGAHITTQARDAAKVLLAS